MVASGNDFVVIDERRKLCGMHYGLLAKKICDRKFGVGADGMLVLGESKAADARMRIFNADGSEAEMCGNGARCTALFAARKNTINLETKAGIIEAKVSSGNVKIRLTPPSGLKLDLPLEVGKRRIKVNFINTGVPHVVIFSEGLGKINIREIGKAIRNHKHFAPAGTNVNFIELIDDNSFKIRTYERGVEDETLACGTGSTASAIIFALKTASVGKINVHTKSGEILSVSFVREGKKFKDVWLEGKARIVFQGEYRY